MKYWVYKDARILGPFDRDSIGGLPDVDASTLVCEGESASTGEADWRPARDISSLAGLPLSRGAAWSLEDPPATFGLLDKLQIETAGLVGDDDFPALAEDLFQDADLKKSFADLLAPRPSADPAQLRQARERITELSAQIETLCKRVSELESAQTDIAHKLVEKEAPAPPPEPAPAPPELNAEIEALCKRVAELESAQTGLAQRLVEKKAEPPSDISGAGDAPPIAEPAPLPEIVIPVPIVPEAESSAAPAPVPELASEPPVVSVSVPEQAPPAAAPPEPEQAVVEAAPAAPVSPLDLENVSIAPPVEIDEAPEEPRIEPLAADKTLEFGQTRSFKVVPTVKSFRIVDAEAVPEAPPAPAAVPAPAAAPAPVPEPASEPPVVSVSVPEQAPPVEPIAFPEVAPVLAPAPAPAAEVVPPAPVTPPVPEPVSVTPGSAPLAPAFPPAQDAIVPLEPFVPAETPVVVQAPVAAAGAPAAPPPRTEEVLARLAKPAPAPQTAPPRPARSNKPFLLVGGAMVALLGAIGFFFLRQPKELKQMADLDDGRARLGAEPVEEKTPFPLAKPKTAAPPLDETPPAPAPEPQPAAESQPAPEPQPAVAPPGDAAKTALQARLDAATSLVKEFPLDGRRGAIGQWLQYSYAAEPSSGEESWSASETSDKTYLVEYRFTPVKSNGLDIHYLFEADMGTGLVIGKNLDAREMLASGPRGGADAAKKSKAKSKPKARSKPAARRAVRRASPAEPPAASPEETPQLPLPEQSELRPPAEDDGSFSSDAPNSGL